jgi:hypothetical protein
MMRIDLILDPMRKSHKMKIDQKEIEKETKIHMMKIDLILDQMRKSHKMKIDQKEIEKEMKIHMMKIDLILDQMRKRHKKIDQKEIEKIEQILDQLRKSHKMKIDQMEIEKEMKIGLMLHQTKIDSQRTIQHQMESFQSMKIEKQMCHHCFHYCPDFHCPKQTIHQHRTNQCQSLTLDLEMKSKKMSQRLKCQMEMLEMMSRKLKYQKLKYQMENFENRKKIQN